jgi:hypothetical protein
MFKLTTTAIVSAALIATAAPTAIAAPVDTSVCYQSDAGTWISDYSASGKCTYGSPLSDDRPYSTLARMAVTITAVIGERKDGSLEARIMPRHYLQYVNECEDIEVVYVHVPTRTIYGDQDSNGKLDGEDCNWN